MLADKFSISRTSINTIIQRALRSGEIVRLKRGLYVHKRFFAANANSLEYKFFIANLLLSLSYISRETALQYYGLLSEASLNYYTSTTLKLPRRFTNKLGIFEYRNINQDLYNGYKPHRFSLNKRELTYLMAEPYKAIFDYLYYRIGLRKLSEDQLFDILDEFRLNYNELSYEQLNKLIKCFK